MTSKKPTTYEELFAQAENYAHVCMRSKGSVPPALFLIGLDGPVACIAESITDEDSKTNFATQARLVGIAHGATALVLVVEAWISSAKPDTDHFQRPSEAPDRRECVVLMGESADRTKIQFLPIRRTPDGEFLGFGKPESQSNGTSSGPLANLLPSTPPDAATREAAQAVLTKAGRIHRFVP